MSFIIHQIKNSDQELMNALLNLLKIILFTKLFNNSNLDEKVTLHLATLIIQNISTLL